MPQKLKSAWAAQPENNNTPTVPVLAGTAGLLAPDYASPTAATAYVSPRFPQALASPIIMSPNSEDLHEWANLVLPTETRSPTRQTINPPAHLLSQNQAALPAIEMQTVAPRHQANTAAPKRGITLPPPYISNRKITLPLPYIPSKKITLPPPYKKLSLA